MASLDQMEGDAVEFLLFIVIVLVVIALFFAAEGSFGLLNWLRGLWQKIASSLLNRVPGETFMGQGKGSVQSGNSAVTNVTDDQAYNSAYDGGTLLGGYLSGAIPSVTSSDYPGPGVLETGIGG